MRIVGTGTPNGLSQILVDVPSSNKHSYSIFFIWYKGEKSAMESGFPDEDKANPEIDSDPFSEEFYQTEIGYYLYGPVCDPQTRYAWRMSVGIDRYDDPDPGEVTVDHDTVTYRYAIVIEDAKATYQDYDEVHQDPDSSPYEYTSSLSSDSILLTVTKAYSTGDDDDHFSTSINIYDDGEEVPYGIDAREVTVAAPGWSASWSGASADEMLAIGVWLDAMDPVTNIPLFAFHGGI
jgi:hypothetical protein